MPGNFERGRNGRRLWGATLVLCTIVFLSRGYCEDGSALTAMSPQKLYIHCLRDATDMQVVLRWEYHFYGAVSNVAGFRIHRREGQGDYRLKTTIPKSGEERNTSVSQDLPTRYTYSYTDRDVQPGVEYRYKVTAFDSAGNEGLSEARICTDPAADPVAGPANVLVVVNRSSPESLELGEYYRRQRGIPEGNVAYLSYSGNPEVTSLKVFEEQVKTPLRSYLTSSGLKDKVLHIVMTYGIPYKIYTRGGRATDSLDAYLADLFDECKSDPNLGMGGTDARYRNPYYLAGSHFSRANGNRGYLVTRLDGPLAKSEDTRYNKDTLHPDDPLQYLKNMVDYALWAEQHPEELSGKGYYDRRYKEPWKLFAGRGDLYISGAYDCWRSMGFAAVLDTNPQLFGTKPTNSGGRNPLVCDDALWYAGWYSHFYADAFEWQKGAIGFHIESWTALNLRTESKFREQSGWLWVPGMIRDGITATMGPVHEPGFGGVPQIDWFFRYFFHGFSFAEAAYMANYSSSGQMVMIGDPLYAPYPAEARKLDRTPPTITVTSPSGGQTVRGTKTLVEGTLDDPAISMLEDAHPVENGRFRYIRSIGSVETKEADLPIILRAADTSGNLTCKVVTVHWVNSPPRLERIPPMEVDEGRVVTLTLKGSDDDNDELTYSFTVRGGVARNVKLNERTGDFQWKPDFDQAGMYEFVFRATDGFAVGEETVSATVKQAGSHPPKFLTSSKKLTVTLGRVAYIELKAEDTDEDVLTFSSEAPLPKGAVLSQSPLGRAGLFWQPTPDQVGSHKIIFKVSDGKGGEDTLPIEVEVLPGGEEKR
ncbi:MAG: TIGR03790 family protein [bacterium]|nr:TIGR03790 family protein [bacterium]